MDTRQDCISFRIVKARKQHKCCECDELIDKDERYHYTSGVWGGTPNSFKQCLNCGDIFNAASCAAFSEDIDGPAFMELKYWFTENEYEGFTGKLFLLEMSKWIGVDANNLNKLLKIGGE